MSEMLSASQIQLLLYFLEAEPNKKTISDAARYMNRPKSTMTHILDSLDKMALMKRIAGRKSILTSAGIKVAKKFQYQRRIMEQYLQYLDISPVQAKKDSMAIISAGLSDEFMHRLEEQEYRMRLKELFSGRQNFNGGELCTSLRDGSYFFPFTIYRNQIKNQNNISMGNIGFEHPCQLIVKDQEGMIYLMIKTVSAQSASDGRRMEGRVHKMQYWENGQFNNAGIEGRYVYFPINSLTFISMGRGRDTLLHGSVCLRMQCSVGDMHMPESTAVFTIFVY